MGTPLVRNPLIDVATQMANALSAPKLKRHHLTSTADGVIISQAGRPDLLLTYEAALAWAGEVDEARNG